MQAARRPNVMDELAGSNVNRSYSLAGTGISVFTFTLVFLYPRVSTGEVNAMLFQAALIVMGLATFAFVFATFHYYGSSLGARIADADRARLSRRGDRLWLLGFLLLFVGPSLILFAVSLYAVGAVWLVMWIALAILVARNFASVQTPHTG